MNAALYQDILDTRLREDAITYAPRCPKRYRNRWTFLQDNDPKHKAKKSMQKLQELVGDRIVNHPANSPDLNPMEDIWSALNSKVQAAKVTTIQGLQKVLSETWSNLDWARIRASVDSMPARLQECLEKDGQRTRY